jgi:hypothetical protein
VDESQYYLRNLSDSELLTYWELFAEYPTPDVRQRERMNWVVRELAREACPQQRSKAALKIDPRRSVAAMKAEIEGQRLAEHEAVDRKYARRLDHIDTEADAMKTITERKAG